MVPVEVPTSMTAGTPDEPSSDAPIVDAGPLGSGPTRLGKVVPEGPSASEDAGASSASPGIPPSKLAQIVPGTKQVQGKMPPDLVERFVRLRFPRLRACYETGLKKDPAMGGKVTISFVISKKGTVRAPSLVSSALSDNATNDCIVHQFAVLTFPRPVEEATVTYPFELVPPTPSAGKH